VFTTVPRIGGGAVCGAGTGLVLEVVDELVDDDVLVERRTPPVVDDAPSPSSVRAVLVPSSSLRTK
jgi:hypothetical protein